MTVQPFLGVWVFDPTQADYGPLPVPRSGVYTLLSPDGVHIAFHVRWSEDDGTVRQIAFDGVADGALHPLPDDGGALRTAVEDGSLISEVHAGGAVVHRAVRVLEDEGATLRITQTLATEQGEVVTRSTYRRSDVKQVLVYRRDLKMRKGKIAAQCAHGSMAVFFRRARHGARELVVPLDGPMALWVSRRFTKVVLSCEGEDDLLAIHAEAERRGLPCALITDSGRTEFGGVPTRTVVALGPAAIPEIDAITGPEGLVATKLA